MILTEEQVKAREESEDNAVNIVYKILGKGQHSKGKRTDGANNRTNEERALIALTAKFDTVKNTAAAFNVSPSAVAAYKKGQTSHNKETSSELSNKQLQETVLAKTDKIAHQAVDKIMAALDLVTPDLIATRPVKEIASIAESLSRVYDKTRPLSEQRSAPQVIIFAPKQRSLDDYNVIEVESSN